MEVEELPETEKEMSSIKNAVKLKITLSFSFLCNPVQCLKVSVCTGFHGMKYFD